MATGGGAARSERMGVRMRRESRIDVHQADLIMIAG